MKRAAIFIGVDKTGGLPVLKDAAIRMNGVGRMPPNEMRFLAQRLNPHSAHQDDHLAPTNGAALLPQEIAQHPRSRKGILQMQLIDPPHQRQRRLATGH